jgi:hypothetical protein
MALIVHLALLGRGGSGEHAPLSRRPGREGRAANWRAACKQDERARWSYRRGRAWANVTLASPRLPQRLPWEAGRQERPAVSGLTGGGR